ncbi:MAG: pyridoxamine 5'-phosphate oxidase [Candidatus Eremiobacteraeota bacterium]|nr:pyridoxamine 5'-phosphate oxidase [Candidatus Eremiobacteraeota bacterium]
MRDAKGRDARHQRHVDAGENDLRVNPIAQLQQWIDEAHKDGVREPVPMSLATVNEEGLPNVRFVLLRGVDDRGVQFYTSYFSRKGRALERHPFAAAALYWPRFERQVQLEGPVQRLSDEESDAYFAGRPRGHQIAAWASEQSEPVASREVLDERFAHFEARFAGEEVPRPHSWGGFVIAVSRLEFWERRENRMHDRLEYRRAGGRWEVRRLQP